jgi:hypothetical protein
MKTTQKRRVSGCIGEEKGQQRQSTRRHVLTLNILSCFTIARIGSPTSVALLPVGLPKTGQKSACRGPPLVGSETTGIGRECRSVELVLVVNTVHPACVSAHEHPSSFAGCRACCIWESPYHCQSLLWHGSTKSHLFPKPQVDIRPHYNHNPLCTNLNLPSRLQRVKELRTLSEI